MKRTTSAVIGAIALATLLGACGSTGTADAPASATTGPQAKSVAPTRVPAPTGKPVLKMTGALSNRNQGSALAFDQQALDSMATETATIHEPFLKKDIEFTGIPMSALLTRAGMSPDATKVQMHALDDYKVEFKVADLMAPGVLLATKAGGARIPVAEGGPIRLLFPPNSAAGKNRDIWIWSIDTVTVS
jgi:hypothetical protein